MRKKFNDTGLCVPDRHYMADTSAKIEQIVRLVAEGEYFTINRPRQYGKTTILSLLVKELNQKKGYLALKTSFEAIDADTYQNQERFLYELLMMLRKRTELLNHSELSAFIDENIKDVVNIPALSRFITNFVQKTAAGEPVALMIDEVDKSANNQLFLDFLGMLRDKYLLYKEGEDFTFQSVILAGVHDVKNLKAQIRPDEEKKFNSPWNIAMDFTVDLSFNPDEIAAMLRDYSRDKGIQPDIPAIAERLHYYTSGYPYLVSKLCKFIDEQIIPSRQEKNWCVEDVDAAFRMIADEGYTTTLFDSLTKNLENNKKLYELISRIAIDGAVFPFTITNPVINLGHLHGMIVPDQQGRCRIHNRIFEQRIYAHIMAEILQTSYHEAAGLGGPEFFTDEGLDVRLILQRFQAFMKENYSGRDAKFLEREGRLLFLSFLRPIINGRGFDFKEPNVSDERRMDVVVTFGRRRYVIELKIWRGPKCHEAGLKQLGEYLDAAYLKQGYLLIYDFNKNKAYRQEDITFGNKQIFAVWV